MMVTNRANEIIGRSLCGLFFVFCLFPYLRIMPFNLDAQPNALILSLPIIILFGRKKIPIEIGLLVFASIVALILLILTNPTPLGLRTFANYASLSLISYATYVALCYCKGISYTLFRFCVYVWFAFGFIQTFFISTFGNFLIYRGAVPAYMLHGRGVSALAVEPTYYGMICIFLIILNYLNFRDLKYYKQLNILLLIQLLLSKSTTVFLFLVLSFMIYCLFRSLRSRKGITLLFTGLISLVAFDYIFKTYLVNVDSRLTNALKVLYDNPQGFLLMDYSVNNRFMHAFFPIKGFFDDWGMPHGMARFNDYLVPLSQDPKWGYLLPYDYHREFRINSAISGALYDLGVFAIPILWVFYKCLKGLTKNGYNGLLCGIILFCMMLNNMPFSQAILPFIFGNIIYLYRSKRTLSGAELTPTIE